MQHGRRPEPKRAGIEYRRQMDYAHTRRGIRPGGPGRRPRRGRRAPLARWVFAFMLTFLGVFGVMRLRAFFYEVGDYVVPAVAAIEDEPAPEGGPDAQTAQAHMHDPQLESDANGDGGWVFYDAEYAEYDEDPEPEANTRFLYRNTALFPSMGYPYKSGYIRAQYVTVLYETYNWLEIETVYGPKWVYLDFTPPLDALDELLRRHGNTLSVFFENHETGFIYQYNATREYFSASVTKAVYALYIFRLAERGLVDLDAMHAFLYEDANWGSGVIIRRYPIGTEFTLRELLRLNISESDNVATLMLRRIHGLEGYKRMIEDMGGNPGFVRDRVMNSRLTANEAGLFAREIFNFIESDSRYASYLKAHMLDNQFPFIVSDYPVASKTGWTRPYAWHDMAIVYAPSPFTLVILSARAGSVETDHADFEEISMAFQEFNDRWFVN